MRRALYVILEKFAQVGVDSDVVALWSDDDGIEALEASLVVWRESAGGPRSSPCSPDGIRTHDLFLEREEVMGSGLDINSLAIPRFPTLQRTSEKRPREIR